jgi:hypothetical protein
LFFNIPMYGNSAFAMRYDYSSVVVFETPKSSDKWSYVEYD